MTTETGRAAGRASLEDFHVGDFLVRPRLNRVAEGGRVVQVQPKIMDVLVLLAARPGEVVTKEELFETVWAGTHVTEHVLSRAISELRKIFGDRPRKARYIETIPKTGYRIVAPVRRADEPSTPPITEEARTDEPTRPAASDAEAAALTNSRANRLNFRIGMAALSCAALIVVCVLLILFVTRDASHVHMHLHR